MLSPDEQLQSRSGCDEPIYPDHWEKYWQTCTLCGRQSPIENNGDSVCPHCNGEAVYCETYEDFLNVIEKAMRED